MELAMGIKPIMDNNTRSINRICNSSILIEKGVILREIIECSNLYYFMSIAKIGGIETFFRQLSKRYKDVDLVFVYRYADPSQLMLIKKYCKCIRYEEGMKFKCKKAFFNFNLDIIDSVDADEYALVIHGDYKMLDGTPPDHPKINKWYGVSQTVCDSYKELTGHDCECTYNPLEYEKPKKIVKLCSACRLNDKVKGGERTDRLIEKLDKYAKEHDVNYMWYMFTNSRSSVYSPNVCYCEMRLDLAPYMADCDFVVQLSDNFEGYNYTVNEALMYGTPIVATPCNVYKELGILDKSMAITLNFDMSNIDEVVEKIFTTASTYKFEYKPLEDNWKNILVMDKSHYEEERNSKYELEALTDFSYAMFDDLVSIKRHLYDKHGIVYAGDILVVKDLETRDYLCGENGLEFKACRELRKIEDEPTKPIEPKKSNRGGTSTTKKKTK